MSDRKDFPARFEKRLPTGFQESVQSMELEEIKKKLYECESHVYQIEKSKDEDEKLSQAREMVKEMLAPYKEAQQAEVAKIKYCFYVLESRGLDISK